MKRMISRLQRELPDTDRDRYDIAYERGRAQARSGLLAGGVAIGSAVGAGLVWLFDPARGSERRAALASRLGGLKEQVGRTAGGTVGTLGDRVNSLAVERGLKQPSSEGSHGDADGRDDGGLGEGYREGFGSTMADPTAPGSQVSDPIQPEEIIEHGSSGPVAGAAHDGRDSVVSSQVRDEEAASER